MKLRTIYDLCVKIFNDNIKSPTIDLVGLTHLTINLALQNATDIFSYTLTLLSKARTPDVIEVLDECTKEYQLVVVRLHQASLDFYGKNYKDMIAKESSTPAAIAACESGMPPAFPFLIERDKQLNILISMSVVSGKHICASTGTC